MENIQLRNFNDSDIGLFNKWLNKDYIIKWYRDSDAWIYEVKNRYNEFNFVHHFIVETDNTPIGFCQYYDYSKGGETWHNNTDIADTVSIDYLLGEEEYLNKGLGIKTVALLIEKIKKETKAKKIIVQPDKENLISRKTLLASGFTIDKTNDFYIKEILP